MLKLFMCAFILESFILLLVLFLAIFLISWDWMGTLVLMEIFGYGISPLKPVVIAAFLTVFGEWV